MIHALPGMGGDHRMYQGVWNTLPNFIAHDWPAYQGETTIGTLAISVCDACGIQDGDILVGSSLGGMVACEILKTRRISKLFLVGSAISPQEISPIFRIFHPLSGATLLKMLQRVTTHISYTATQMFASADVNFMLAMRKAIFEWKGLESTEEIVRRIHGRSDFVIPLPDKVERVLDGGHLITMTHAEECVDFIRRYV
ncbi:MAG TPA: alpha/beta hydrolase [Steroidobacteraceae bacterium]|nr:alpha/beta hydrolase [Steroidobacteraceae bacterium]